MIYPTSEYSFHQCSMYAASNLFLVLGVSAVRTHDLSYHTVESRQQIDNAQSTDNFRKSKHSSIRATSTMRNPSIYQHKETM